ncbi:MAG TPA: PaaI family thioesterase [Burkholderiaceae bacterium]|nr:PaaI family thioesterase [Burkholderiaceae bacterium]
MTNAVTETPNALFCSEDAPYFGVDVPFMSYIGVQAEHIEEGYARTRLPYNPQLVNSRGDVHGGTLMSVLDFTLSAAARGHDPLGIGIATIEMSTHFLDTARGELVFESRVLRRGRSTAFVEGSATDADGKVVCVARGAFRLIKRNG